MFDWKDNDNSQLDPSELGLEDSEHEEVRERTAPRALVVYEAIRQEGESELRRSSSALAWSGLAAGLSMGFSLVAEGLLRSKLPDAPWSPLITKLGYSVGFLIVVLGRQQLFTENTLTPILPLLRRPAVTTLLHVLRLWVIVFAANIVGTLAFAWVIGSTSIFETNTKQAFDALGHEALVAGFWTTFLRAIFAGWLIALMVWLLPFAETSRIWVIILLTYLIGLGRFAHIIAGSVNVFYVAVTGTSPWSEVFINFLVPTFLGNVIGGVALVAAINHAQAVGGVVRDGVDR